MKTRTTIYTHFKKLETSNDFEDKVINSVNAALNEANKPNAKTILLDRLDISEEIKDVFYWLMRISINERYFTLYGDQTTREDFERVHTSDERKEIAIQIINNSLLKELTK